MKKHLFIIFLLFAMPALLYSVTDDGTSILKLSMEPIPFNERRDSVLDSPYNAFDGDVKSAALYSDFTMEFIKPVTIDQIKIMNGNASDKNLFKKQNRERDIEITLYTTAVKSDKKVIEKKKKKAPAKKIIKKIPEKKKENTEKKILPDNSDTDKPELNNEKKEELKKPDTPEKVVQADDLEIFEDYKPDGVKFILTAAETVIEITDSKKDKISNSDAIKKRIAEEDAKKKSAINENDNTSVQKGLAGVDSFEKVEPDKPVKKTATPDIKKNVKSEKKIQGKVPVKPVKKNSVKKSTAVKKTEKKIENKSVNKSASVKKTPAKKSIKPAVVKPAVKKTESKKTAEKKPVVPKKVEIVKEVKKEVKEKVEKKDAASDVKKDIKTEVKKDMKKDVKGVIKKDLKKEEVKKDIKKEIKKQEKKTENKKEEKKNSVELKKETPAVIPEEKVVVKKMSGVVRIEDDKNGRVLVYTSLRDTMEYQNINLNGEYVVTKIEFRTRDDEYYFGSETDRSGITEIGFFNNGKRVSIQGIDIAKKTYSERYNKNLRDSLYGQTFIILENNEIVLRAAFKKDGKIEFYDRFKCTKKGDSDCTYLSMPDAWRVENGKLLMRYHTLWRVWKYELDSQSDMLDENGDFYPPRWMKIYYKSDTGYTDKYLDLVRVNSGIRTE